MIQKTENFTPDRIMVGSADSELALVAQEHGVDWHIAFVTDNGWSLGAPKELELFAYRQLRELWAYYILKSENVLKNIDEYKVQEK
jgi:hypothetical protein